MRKQLFLAIVNRLTEKVPELQFIDLWNEQLATIQGNTWPLPAVFIEFEQYDVHQQANHVRTAEISVRLHIITRAVNYNGSKDERMNQALAIFDLIDNINAAMQGLCGDCFASFMLTASATNHNHAELIESIERWTTRVTDASAIRKGQRVELSDIDIVNNA
ncbi:MAG: hypothetical protein IJ144_05905 [Prevotella sp.]|nr:hypothetical protein [Prevotella sp.]